MSIFKQSFKKFVSDQFAVRQKVVAKGNSGQKDVFRRGAVTGNNGELGDKGVYYAYAQKQCVIRMASLVDLVRDINPLSKILTNCEVIDVKEKHLLTSNGVIYTKHSIFCAGLFSDRLAKKDNVRTKMKIVGFRGDYYYLKEHAKKKINNLIYPVPNPEFPFLGVHFTRMTDESIECGPNAVFTFKREGYGKTDFNFKDTWEALTFSGTWKLFINHWKFGINEYRRAFSKYLFLKETKKMIPTLNMDDIVQQRSGVRAMALAKSGKVIDDFLIVKSSKNIHVLNAPSPAATACMSIAKKIMLDASDYFKI